MKKHLIVVCVLNCLIWSCKKENSSINSITGSWSGKWGNGSATPNNSMTVIFRDNGSARVLYGYISDTSTAIYRSEGSYTLVDGVATFSYTEGSDVYIHKANPDGSRMDGTWGTAPSTTDGGKFYLDKQ